MGPDLWTTFVLFGIPLVVGLLGVRTGGLLCYRAYLRYTTSAEANWAEGDGNDTERTVRGDIVRGAPLFAGGGLLALHSARWLIRILW